MITSRKKAQSLYRDVYMRWCYELSHDKNVNTAKSICDYLCNEVLGFTGADRGYSFWLEVKEIINTSTHEDLMDQNVDDEERAILKFNNGRLAILCSGCSKILKVGTEFTEEENKFAKGETTIPPQFCENCKPNSYDTN